MMPQETKAKDVLKEMYDSLKNENDDGDRQLFAYTCKDGKARIYLHGSRREFTKFILAAMDEDLFDIEVVEKFVKLKKLKDMAENCTLDVAKLLEVLK